MTPELLALLRRIASLKALPSQARHESLADALYRDVVIRALEQPEQTAEQLMQGLFVRAMVCSFLGDVTASDVARLTARETQHYTDALRQLIAPALLHARMMELAASDLLPVLKRASAPDWVDALAARARAGHEGPGGVRFIGPQVETQAGHALTTALTAFAIKDAQAGVLALAHNAHLAIMPDTPHLVDEALGPSVLGRIERRAVRSLYLRLPIEWRRTPLARQVLRAHGDAEARAAVDDADFIDRLIWLFDIRPPWLKTMAIGEIERTLCNYDTRLARQQVLLRATFPEVAANQSE